MSKLNILQLYDYMELGGAESHIITLSKALIDRGHNVQVGSSLGPSVTKLNNLGIKFHNMDIYNQSHYFKNAGHILQIIQDQKIDIVHVHPFHSQIVMSLVKLVCKIPTVTTIHGAYKTPSTEGLNEFFDSFIFVSEETNKFHLDNKLIREDVVEVIPNCVPSSSSRRASILGENVVKIAYVSRLDNDKFPSIIFFIRCIEEIVKYMDVEITIIGQGTKYNDVVKLADDVNQKVNKKVISVVNGLIDVIRYMETVDIVVGVGRVLLEALSINKIPICIGNKHYGGIIDKEKLMRISEVNFTDRNSTRDLLPELFIKDLLRIKQNPEQVLIELDETILQFKKYFDIGISVEKHENLYGKVIDEYPRIKFNLSDILKYKQKMDEVDKILLANELKVNGYTYKLDDAKDTKVLLMPNFLDENDRWSKILIDLVMNNKFQDTTTIVIRIDNRFHSNLKEIIKKVQKVLNPYENKYKTDILIDCDYQNYVTEILFLSEMDYFIPTNNNQQDITYKCKILEVEV
ncbi:MAG TPA: glycosyltransferase, partial [Chondromyces sp.]|nr:glycosyltransferase [Chondromyces sp.]